MNTKLTLRLDKTAIENAKTYARSRQTSLSSLVENYFRALAEEKKDMSGELSMIVRELSGIIELPEDFDLKEEYSKHLIEKYTRDA